MLQPSEIQVMNDRINSLETTVLRSVEASESVSKSVNNLLLEFKERDVRHEFEREEQVLLHKQVDKLTSTMSNYVDTNAPILARTKKSQDRWDSFFTSLSTNAGKILVGIILLGTMVMLGLDPRNLFTK